MAESGNFKLIIEDEEGRRSVVPVELGEVSIGRLDGNTIRLNERNVSRRHARFVRENGHVVAEDLDSYNGVWVNGDRIKGRQPLHDGDTIRIGDFQLELRGEGLQRRTEETTQRTLVSEGSDVTRPDIRLQAGMGLGPQPVSAEPTIPREAPGAPTDPTGVDPDDVEEIEEPESRHEPTALIRMDELRDDAPRRRNTSALAGQKAKLICVSTSFAGREFEIDKSEIIIGRTDENDVAIDHRSVSRHHAKISVTGRACRIADLKSANGTLVNGEEYAQIELKKGDLIELGHVKFRFVPAGETYELTEEELAAMKQSGAATGKTTQAPTGEQPSIVQRNLKPIIVGGLSAVGVVALGIVFAVARSGDEAQPSVVEQRAEPQAAPQAAVGAAGQAGAESASGSGGSEMIRRAQALLGQGQWREAAKLADAVLVLEPASAPAQDLARRARSELKAEELLNQALSSIDRQEWAEATHALEQVPADSAAQAQVQALTAKVKSGRVQSALDQANQAARDGRWEDVREAGKTVAELDPGNPEVERLNRSIEEGERSGARRAARQPVQQKAKTTSVTAAANSTPTPVASASSPPKQTAVSAPPANPTPPPPVDARALYQQGIAALQQQQNDAAIDLLDKCVKADAKFGLCYRALGIAHARIKNGPKAARFYRLYLKVMPSAPDAKQVEELLKQYEGQPQ